VWRGLTLLGAKGLAAAVRVAIGTAGGHPLTPFVVGEEGACDEDDGEDGEEQNHEDSGSHGGAVDHTLESESDSSSPLNTNKHKFFLAI